MPFNIDTALGVHADTLVLRSRRAAVLAANLANAETPRYKARDLDFRTVLARTRSGADNGPVLLRVSHPAHIPDPRGSSVGGKLLYRMPIQPSLDGNTVDTQIEKAEFTQNALRYMASLRFLNGRITGLMTAIRGE